MSGLEFARDSKAGDGSGERTHLLDVVPRPDIDDDVLDVAQLPGHVQRVREGDEDRLACVWSRMGEKRKVRTGKREGVRAIGSGQD